MTSPSSSGCTLALFKKTPLKPYLPLEVRYLIRPSEEVFLYLSNNSDNKTERLAR